MPTVMRDALAAVTGMKGIAVAERDGGTVLDIATRSCQAAIALQGAQVLHWQPAGQSHDVLWFSPVTRFGGGKAIRGGVPICWPWFGQSATAGKPQHGYARNAVWHVAGAKRTDDDVTLAFELPSDCAGIEHLDGTARLRFSVTLGAALDMNLETSNAGSRPFTITEALHTYLRVADVAQVSIDGLDGATFRDNTDGGRAKQQAGLLTLPRETVSIFDEAAARHVLVDPQLRRRVVVTRSAGRSTVVWNPGAAAASMDDIPPPVQTEFVCIESGNVGSAAVTLAPGASSRVGQRLEIEPI